MKRLWILLVLGLIAALGIACSDESEDVPSTSPAVSARSPGVTVSSSSAPSKSPAPIPSGWQTYSEPTLGFSVAYPADLAAKNGTQASPGSAYITFRSAADDARGFAVTVWSNPTGLSLDDWVSQSTACLQETVKQVVISDEPGRLCSANFVDGNTGFAAVAARATTVFYITGGKLAEQEIADLVANFRLAK